MAVAKAMFTNKYKIQCLTTLIATVRHFMWAKKIYFSYHKKDGGWTIFAVCNDESDEGDEGEILTPFLAISLIQKKQQSEGVIMEMPEPGSEEEKVLVANDDN